MVDFGWPIKKIRTIAVLKIGLASGFDHGHVGIHDAIARSGHLLDLRAARIMVPVGMTDEQNFCILEFESELFECWLRS
jgi:hypothetical protein